MRQKRQESDRIKFSTLQRQNMSDFSEQALHHSRKLAAVPTNVWEPTTEVLQEYDMIKDGDRVMVCLSGGKDSLSLLHVLQQYKTHLQTTKGIGFTLAAATVEPKSLECSILSSHLKKMEIQYFVGDQNASASETDTGESRFYIFSTSLIAFLKVARQKNSRNFLAQF